MHPIILKFNEYILYSYGTVMTVTFLLCLFLLRRNYPKKLFSLFDLYNFCLVILFVVFFSNIVMQNIYYLFLENYAHKVTLAEGISHGRSSHAALFVVLIALYGYTRLRKIPILATLDVLIPYAILALSLQRTFGCFLAGCCYGVPTDLAVGVVFPQNSPAGHAFPETSVHPTQLYYGTSAFASWIFLLSYQKRQMVRKQVGKVTAVGLGLFSITYFTIAFFRGDITERYLGLSISQYYSIIILTVSILLYLWSSRKITTISHIGKIDKVTS